MWFFLLWVVKMVILNCVVVLGWLIKRGVCCGDIFYIRI